MLACPRTPQVKCRLHNFANSLKTLALANAAAAAAASGDVSTEKIAFGGRLKVLLAVKTHKVGLDGCQTWVLLLLLHDLSGPCSRSAGRPSSPAERLFPLLYASFFPFLRPSKDSVFLGQKAGG